MQLPIAGQRLQVLLILTHFIEGIVHSYHILMFN